jgi:hypothetical protein
MAGESHKRFSKQQYFWNSNYSGGEVYTYYFNKVLLKQKVPGVYLAPSNQT